MENFKPTKYFIDNELTTLSDRHLRRNCAKALENGETYVKIGKNKKQKDIWLIEVSSIGLVGERIRKPKKEIKPENYFNIEVSINFNDRSDYVYYSEIVRLFKFYSGCDLVYKIENDPYNKYNNHLHMGVHGQYKTVKKYIDYIVQNILQKKCNMYYDKSTGEHKSSVRVRKIVDEDAFVDYISKGYDRLGGDFPIYLI
ncbi:MULTISPECIES: hypothetical protein [Empedobacter]|uniref:hypothetical protein n=1 Tax=Empedobacter TaxID=59734 RepID=UPI0023F0849D|nr:MULTISPECIES: hypothetical protein [Empedobacter]